MILGKQGGPAPARLVMRVPRQDLGKDLDLIHKSNC